MAMAFKMSFPAPGPDRFIFSAAKIAAINQEMEPILKELKAAAKKVPGPKSTYHGWVWLFERQPAAAAKKS